MAEGFHSSRGRDIFFTASKPALGHTKLPMQYVLSPVIRWMKLATYQEEDIPRNHGDI
jgi:hypothetical protein